MRRESSSSSTLVSLRIVVGLKVALELTYEVGERVVEGVECAGRRHAKPDGFVGCAVVEVDAGAVVARVPEEGDLDAAADARRELSARAGGGDRVVLMAVSPGVRVPAEPRGSAPPEAWMASPRW